MPLILTGLSFEGTEPIAQTGRNDYISNGGGSPIDFADDSDADEDVPYDDLHTGVSNQAKNKPRVPGGKAAVPKRITMDYDSDDARLVCLKKEGYTDEQVTEKLKVEGRVAYKSGKAVGARWAKLRRLLETAHDEELDEELTDWHAGEDDLLDKSFDELEQKYNEEMKRLEDKKWREISDNLAKKLKCRKKYTAKACRERFEGLRSNEALPPIELDRDQAGRKALREARIGAAKALRAEKEAEVRRVKQKQKLRKQERAAEKAEQDRRMIQQHYARQEGQKREALRKKMDQQEREARKVAKEAARVQAKAEADWKRTEANAEKALYFKLTGKRMQRYDWGFGRTESPAERLADDSLGGCNQEDTLMASMDNECDITDTADDEDTCIGTNVSEAAASEITSDTLSAGNADKTPMPLAKAKVTAETLLSPRVILTDSELDTLLYERRLRRRGPNECHPEVVARLAAADEALSVSQLGDLLGKHLLARHGTKSAMITRLADADAAKGVNGGLMSGDDRALVDAIGEYSQKFAHLLQG